MRAAVENGADAVYFGLQQFNARLRAANFSVGDLPEIMDWLHERGVKGYVTMNTLAFPSELELAAATLRACSEAGVDAVLIQDLGLALLAGRMVPGLPVHASTQMTVTCAESVRALEAFGLKLERVVAAREMNRKELRRLGQETEKEVEVFVHGAICVAYSGQCLTSEALGGRSANRGECAQACRLPYDLVVDGETRDTEDVKYLLSPKDLSAYEDIGDLIESGIVSLKIEGRLKSPEYVAATVQSYREAVDHAMVHEPLHLPEATRRKLEMTFSRGFTGGYLHATDHQAVVEGRFPKKRGLFLGRVLAVEPPGIRVRLEGPLKLGDGVVFDEGKPGEKEQGGRVYEIKRGREALRQFDPLQDGGPTEMSLFFAADGIRFRSVNVGDRVWKTSDPKLDAELAASYAPGKIHHHRPVTAHVVGRLGEPLKLTLSDEHGHSATALDTAPAEAALNRPLGHEVLEQQIGRLGTTPFALAGLEADLEGNLMVPVSRINDLRRRAVEALIAAAKASRTGRPTVEGALEALREEMPKASPAPTAAPVSHAASPAEPIEFRHGSHHREAARAPITIAAPTRTVATRNQATLSVLCRTLEQVQAMAATEGIETIYTDFEDVRLHKEARALIPANGPRFAPAGLRIVKPGEAGFVRVLLKANPDAVLVRNLATWEILRHEAPELPFIADFSLNIANELTAGLHRRNGFGLLTPSYDLNIEQLLDLLRAAPADWFEVTVHQYMPMFHMEHCVFCRFLSTGTDYTNCGRPCETHAVSIRDRMGFEHPVKADAGCRNTVFNATAQSASAYLEQIRGAGVKHFRLDLLTEDAGRARDIVAAYLPAVRGETDGSDLWRRLRVHSKLGVTKGSLDHE